MKQGIRKVLPTIICTLHLISADKDDQTMQRETSDQISAQFAEENIAKLTGEPPVTKEDLVYMTIEDRIAF